MTWLRQYHIVVGVVWPYQGMARNVGLGFRVFHGCRISHRIQAKIVLKITIITEFIGT